MLNMRMGEVFIPLLFLGFLTGFFTRRKKKPPLTDRTDLWQAAVDLGQDLVELKRAASVRNQSIAKLVKKVERKEAERRDLPPRPEFDTQPQWFKGDEEFPLRVVGESHYMNELSEICGGYTEDGVDLIKWGTLTLEDANKYDRDAVQVQINNKPVGYLARPDAKAFRERIAKEGLTEKQFLCKANIRGGWSRPGEDFGYFGVRLDVLLYG